MFHLDGADATATEWVDKVGRVSFAMTNITLDDNGGVVFNSETTSHGISNSVVRLPQVPNGTIEVVVCAKNVDSGMVFWPCATNNSDMTPLAFGYYNKTIIASCSVNYKLQSHSVAVTDSIQTYSFSNETIVVNKQKYNPVYADFWSGLSYGNYARLGCSGIGTNYARLFNGTIYQIRMYDRVLTEAEQLYNQNIDYTKYKII